MTAKKTNAETQVDIVLLVGQLLEATTAAADGLKTIGTEVRRNSATIVSTAQKLKTLHDTVQQLDRVLRGSGGHESLLGQMHTNNRMLEDVKSAITAVQEETADLRAAVDDVKHVQAQITGGKTMLFIVIGGLTWLVTTLIALYAAFR